MTITRDDILTSSGKYPERMKHPECTDEVKENALDLSIKINACLHELGEDDIVSSGFRTSLANAKTPGAAEHSQHMHGNAGDLTKHSIGVRLKKDYQEKKERSLLVRHDLYMEDPDYTITDSMDWTHLQRVPPKSGKRIFIP
jgi:hypothetical protein